MRKFICCYFFSLTAFLWAQAPPILPSQSMGLNITNVELTEHDTTMILKFDFSLSKKLNLQKKEGLILQPIFKVKEELQQTTTNFKLAPIILSGNKYIKTFLRDNAFTKYSAQNPKPYTLINIDKITYPYSFTYQISFPYKSTIIFQSFLIQQQLNNCCKSDFIVEESLPFIHIIK